MSSDPSPIPILAVDDHPLFRQGIAALVAGQPDMILVSEAANGREAIQRSLNAATSDQLQSDWERKRAFRKGASWHDVLLVQANRRDLPDQSVDRPCIMRSKSNSLEESLRLGSKGGNPTAFLFLTTKFLFVNQSGKCRGAL